MQFIRTKIVLTGFMGVGKSTVANHLGAMLEIETVDLDDFIEAKESRSVAEILQNEGEANFRAIETRCLDELLKKEFGVISLGGGTFAIEENRKLIKESERISVWLESTFDHCWRNIRASKIVRPLANDRAATLALYEARSRTYCLADWHFVISAGKNSCDVARQIVSDVFE